MLFIVEAKVRLMQRPWSSVPHLKPLGKFFPDYTIVC